MLRKSLSAGPTGTNKVSLDAQHLVRHWRGEFGCSEEAPSATPWWRSVGNQRADVQRYLERQRVAS